MTDTSICSNCGGPLRPDDTRCPGCGMLQPREEGVSTPPRGATSVFLDSTDEEGGSDTWPGIRRQLEAAAEGEFQIVRELGRGGMAAVYLAHDLALGRPVAIKVMAPGLLLGPGMVERFRQEAVTVARLHHPNIVTIHTVRQTGSLHFFVMQLVEGGSLEGILQRPEPLPIPLVQAILYQVGTGLAYAHSHGVIHRDIKPANVLLDGDGNAILTDFGIAKVATATNLTQTGSTIGTPAYMSPEQCLARELSGASDQYSLGVVAYEMLVGRPPFAGSPFEIMQAHTSEAVPGIRGQRTDCPEELEAAVLRMLGKDPAERFATVAEAIEAIGGYLPGPRDPLRLELAHLVRPDVQAPTAGWGQLSPIPSRSPSPVPAPSDSAAPAHGTTPATPTPTPATPTPTPATPTPTTTAADSAPTQVAPGPTRPSEGKPRRRSRLPWLVGGTLGLAVLGTAAALAIWGGPDSEAPPTGPSLPTIASISFASPAESLSVGTTTRVRAHLTDTDGQTVTGQEVVWTSSDPEIAAVEGVSDEAVVTATGAGATEVLASTGGVAGRLQIVVAEPSPGALTVSTSKRELQVGEDLVLQAALTGPDGQPVPGAPVAWSSSDPSVLTVDPERGVVTARSLGRARITASSGEQSNSVSLSVVGQVESLSLTPPSAPLAMGRSVVVRATVTARPGAYRGAGGIRWSSSDAAVASVVSSGGDSAVVALLGEGQTILSAQADDVRGTLTLRVQPSTPAVSVALSPTSVTFEAVEGGTSPAEQNVEVTVTGGADPFLGVVQYEGSTTDWLRTSLEGAGGQAVTLTLRADPSGLEAGSYQARVPVGAGGASRELSVRLDVAPRPVSTAVEPTPAAEGEIAELLSAYAAAINAKDEAKIRELYPSISQDGIRDLIRIQETDLFQVIPLSGTLRAGREENTLDIDVSAGIVPATGAGQTRRMIYTVGRGEKGWYIVAIQTSG